MVLALDAGGLHHGLGQGQHVLPALVLDHILQGDHLLDHPVSRPFLAQGLHPLQDQRYLLRTQWPEADRSPP
jgi:hypothetical protein